MMINNKNDTRYVTSGFRRFLTGGHFLADPRYILSVSPEILPEILKECLKAIKGEDLTETTDTYDPLYGCDITITVKSAPDDGDILIANNAESIYSLARIVFGK